MCLYQMQWDNTQVKATTASLVSLHIRAVSVGVWGADVTEQVELCSCFSAFPRLLAGGTDVPLHV